MVSQEWQLDRAPPSGMSLSRGPSRLFPDGPCIIVPDTGDSAVVVPIVRQKYRFKMGGPLSLNEVLHVFPDFAFSDMRAAHLFKDLLRTIKEGVHVHSDFGGLDMSDSDAGPAKRLRNHDISRCENPTYAGHELPESQSICT